MIRGFYSAGSALDTAALNQDVVAENLANATTPGYRRQGMAFETLQRALSPANGGNLLGVQNGGIFTTFEPGPIQHTGNPFDLALAGDAFFVLDGPTGPVYTRSGAFDMNAQGELQNKSGLRVRGEGGPITVPLTAGSVVVNREGVVLADGIEVGRLQLAQFDNPSQLRRAGPTLFDGPAPRQPDPGAVRVEQGYQEGSNVQVVNEMVAMMIGMRQYEAAERALRTLSEAVALNTRPQT